MLHLLTQGLLLIFIYIIYGCSHEFGNLEFKLSALDFEVLFKVLLSFAFLSVLNYFNLSYLCKVLQLYVTDLQDKMTGISLYAVVTNIMKERNSQAIFILEIKDTTGAISAKLHFSKSWY